MFFDNPFKTRLPKVDEALVGRDWPIFPGGVHAVLGNPMTSPAPSDFKQIILVLHQNRLPQLSEKMKYLRTE